jgi:tetratricopeptide (TPR) repeat protein/predicted protein tyrosine phosphatase
VDPGPGLQKTHQRILAADPALDTSAAVGTRIPPKAATAPPATATLVPAQQPADLARFTGRKDELEQIALLVPHEDRPPRAAATVVVHGMAGIGKTALAVHAVHRLAPRFPDGQLYADLRGFDPADAVLKPADALAQFLESLGVAAKNIPPTEAGRSALYRSMLADRRVLVLLDNARDAGQVRPLLPGAPGCLALVTSRDQMAGLTVSHHASILPLALFDIDDAREFLAAVLGVYRVDAEPSAVQAIIEYCGGLPLALAIVAARAARAPDFPLSTVVDQLSAARGGLDAFTLGSDPAVNTRAVFSWSYRALGAQAARLFRLLALHPGPDFTVDAAAALTALPVHEASQLLEELAGANLLTEHTAGRFTGHDLLRAYAAELVAVHDEQDERDQARHRLLDYYTQTGHRAEKLLTPGRRPIPLAEPRPGVVPKRLADLQEALTWYAAEYRVMLTLLKTCAADHLDDHARQLAWVLENYLDSQDLWHDLLSAQQIALDAARRLGDPEVEARACRGVARAQARLGRNDKAQEYLEDALRLLGEHGDVVTRAETHRLLTWVLERRNANSAALVHARHALKLHLVSGDRLGQANSLNSIGWCHAQLGNFHQTLVCCRIALRKLEGTDYRQATASTWDSIGYAYSRLGRYDEALAHYQHAVDLLRRLESHSALAETLDSVGDIHLRVGHAAQARAAWSEALEIYADLEDPGAARLREKLAALR